MTQVEEIRKEYRENAREGVENLKNFLSSIFL